MSAIMHSDPSLKKTHAELLYESQMRKSRQFNMWVSVTWGGLFLFLIYLFSGQSFLGFETIELNLEFIQKNFLFIAGGLWQTLLVSVLSITLAIFLALVAALGRLSSFPPFYALSTFYVSLIRGTPL
ncbi:MAG: hypothetical protein EHM38_10155, partial [Geobacteraceae bacterium]